MRLILLAENITGYENLLKLVTASNLDGFYYKPRVDNELLKRHNIGLIAILPTLNSEVSSALKTGDTDKALSVLMRYKNTFGKKTDTPIAAGHEIYYIAEDDKPARNTLLSVSNNGVREIADEDDLDFSFVYPEEMEKRFADIPEAVANTKIITERITLELTIGRWVFPHVETINGKTHDEE